MDKAKGKSKPTSNGSHRVATSGDIEVSTYLEIAKEIGGEPSVSPKETIPGAEHLWIEDGTHLAFWTSDQAYECQETAVKFLKKYLE